MTPSRCASSWPSAGFEDELERGRAATQVFEEFKETVRTAPVEGPQTHQFIGALPRTNAAGPVTEHPSIRIEREERATTWSSPDRDVATPPTA